MSGFPGGTWYNVAGSCFCRQSLYHQQQCGNFLCRWQRPFSTYLLQNDSLTTDAGPGLLRFILLSRPACFFCQIGGESKVFQSLCVCVCVCVCVLSSYRTNNVGELKQNRFFWKIFRSGVPECLKFPRSALARAMDRDKLVQDISLKTVFGGFSFSEVERNLRLKLNLVVQWIITLLSSTKEEVRLQSFQCPLHEFIQGQKTILPGFGNENKQVRLLSH